MPHEYANLPCSRCGAVTDQQITLVAASGKAITLCANHLLSLLYEVDPVALDELIVRCVEVSTPP